MSEHLDDLRPSETLQPVFERLSSLLSEPEELVELTRHLHRRLRALADPRMRRVSLAEMLGGLDDAGLLGLLHHVQVQARAGGAASREILNDLARFPDVLSSMDYERRSDLYRVARGAGLKQVARLFLGDRLRTNPSVEESSLDNDFLTISLGERRAVARSHDRFLLDRAMHDRNPLVIAALLDNPRLVERDAVRMAAMRPTRVEILNAIAAHPKWSARAQVRFALVCNPSTPNTIAQRFLRTLLEPEVRQLLGMSTVPEPVRRTAREILDQKLKHPQE